MTREEQKASDAKKYYPNDINCYDAFLHGVNWADKHPANVWHDISEEPKFFKWFLAQIGDDAFDTFVMAMSKNQDWKNLSNGINIRMWAYIDDLLHKGGKK